MVIMSGQVPTPRSARTPSGIDTVGITRPCVKHNFLVKGRRQGLASTMKKAFHSPHRPPWPGPGRHPEGRDHEALRVRVPGPMRSYNPVTRAWARSKKAVQLLLEPSAR